jgi:hypothetical protein
MVAIGYSLLVGKMDEQLVRILAILAHNDCFLPSIARLNFVLFSEVAEIAKVLREH